MIHCASFQRENPQEYYKQNLQVIWNRKRGHLPILTLINTVIALSGGINGGSKVGKGKNISSNCSRVKTTHMDQFSLTILKKN